MVKILLADFHRWQLKHLIPAFGDTIDEVVKFILTDWLSKNGNVAEIHNDDVKKLMESKKK